MLVKVRVGKAGETR